jgi:hypothetical protein
MKRKKCKYLYPEMDDPLYFDVAKRAVSKNRDVVISGGPKGGYMS